MIARKSPTAAVARAAPSGKPTPEFRALLLDALHDRWRTWRSGLKRCRKKYSEAAVHDLRVATRRLISALDLLAGIHPEGKLRKARRRLKRRLEMLGPLRDVQVQLRTIDKMLPSFPELQGLYNALQQRERKLVQRLTAALKRVKTGKLEKAMRAVIRQAEGFLDTPAKQAEKLTAAVDAVGATFNQVVERKLAIDPTDSATIHRMRVAFKKFRYMTEALAPMMDWVTSKQLKAMNDFQGSMGDIQDAEVLLASVTAFAQQQGKERDAAFTRVLEELSRRRTALIDAFLASADTLYTFWKPTS
jgi:CHAD domain-containing protein